MALTTLMYALMLCTLVALVGILAVDGVRHLRDARAARRVSQSAPRTSARLSAQR